MGMFMIVSRAERLDEYRQLAEEYQVSFEINDFYNPAVLDSEEQRKRLVEAYLQEGIPRGSTLHGAFYDVVVFSQDERIQEISRLRMKQSMEIAQELGVRGVVFHTNCSPMLSNPEYDRRVVHITSEFIRELLTEFSGLQIFLENMFDGGPAILAEISEILCKYPNYGVCLDYAHASLSDTPVSVWVQELAPYVKHLHINDNDLKRDLHLAVGSGRIDWEEFAGYYREKLSHCSVLIETARPENQRRSLEYLRKLEGLY